MMLIIIINYNCMETKSYCQYFYEKDSHYHKKRDWPTKKRSPSTTLYIIYIIHSLIYVE